MGGILSRRAADSGGEGEPVGSLVKTFHTSENWRSHYNEIKGSSKLVVIDFSASWCGPCRFIAPAFRALAGKFTDVEFVKIDVDELRDVAEEFNVEAMPTFVLLKNGKELDRVVGATKDELEKKIDKYKVT